MMNCKNCGAPVLDGYCKYCGTDYSKAREIQLKIDERKIKAEALKIKLAMDIQLERLYRSIYH